MWVGLAQKQKIFLIGCVSDKMAGVPKIVTFRGCLVPYLAFEAADSSLFRFLLDPLDPRFAKPVESAGLSSILYEIPK